MKHLILLLTLILAGSTAVSTQEKDGGPGATSQVCGPVQKHEFEVAYALKNMAVTEGCSEVLGREISPSQWFLYGVKLSNTSPAYLPYNSPDICSPRTFGSGFFDVRMKEIVEIEGCTEFHLLTVSATQWTAYGVRLTTF